ncbi:DENN domain-containing protein 11-like [Centruroides vittatus]|uniref:DENN domain-containing protein 11-like n=3 Tax=Centruroides TaxID=6875 RepID=UPI00350ED363
MGDEDDKSPLLKQTFHDFDNNFDQLENITCSVGNFYTHCDDRNQKGSKTLVSVFVVVFDIRAGNILEWALPNDYNLSGIEFKAMTSGSHKVQTDFVYFKWNQLYGLACFENMSVNIAEERGARMKSVGILSISYASLHQHKSFLKNQVRFLLEHTDCYDNLINYYEEEKGILLPSYNVNISRPLVSVMETRHPEECFSEFVKFFEDKIFVLWKFALLKKRILFFSSPPIGNVCHRVYSTNCLVAHSMHSIENPISQPLFYVNIADIETLQDEMFYIACTTEKIFESKTHLYDLYIDNHNLRVSNPTLKQLLNSNNSDKIKYNELCKIRTLYKASVNENCENNGQEVWFTGYFLSLNNLLFDTLMEVSKTSTKLWTRNHMKLVGLHPVYDYEFLSELIKIYGIDIHLCIENPFCPSLSCCH